MLGLFVGQGLPLAFPSQCCLGFGKEKVERHCVQTLAAALLLETTSTVVSASLRVPGIKHRHDLRHSYKNVGGNKTWVFFPAA